MELLSDSIQSQRANIQRRDFPQFIRNPLSRLFMGTPFRKPFFILFQASLLHFWFPPIRGGTISIACFANHARLPKGHASVGLDYSKAKGSCWKTAAATGGGREMRDRYALAECLEAYT